MSNDLSLVCQIMYLSEGFVSPGDEDKIARLEKKISEWKRDVVDKENKKINCLPRNPTKEEMASEFSALENNFDGYWCEGEECKCLRTHWVIHASASTCWDCMHDPCACSPPLVWDDMEKAYFRFFLSCDGKIKKNIWMSEPTSDLEQLSYKRYQKKRKERLDRVQKEKDCHENQKEAHDKGYCCHEHATLLVEEAKVKMENKGKKARVDGPDHCIHCDEDPCMFVQIESNLGENDAIYFDEGEYEKNPVTYNSARRKRAFQYAAFILWEGVNYRKQHCSCVEDGVRALFPPFDGKIMGFKTR
jgi:hypothetical protein